MSMLNGYGVLDYGSIRFIEDWGRGDSGEAEAGIIEAARQSTQGAFRGWDLDQKLLSFLYTQRPAHSGPFEFAGMVIEVRAPIFVFREWHRHRTQSYAEMSARYAPLEPINYIPDVERLMTASKSNKQAGKMAGAPDLTEESASETIDEMMVVDEYVEKMYQKWLNRGVPKELARIKMPVGRYSQMRAQATLRNWLAFMTLRYDPAAQWEIQQYARGLAELLQWRFPRTWALFEGSRA